MTRADVIRRLDDAIGQTETFCSCAGWSRCLPRVLDVLRAIAREPGGAEAVAEAVGLTVDQERIEREVLGISTIEYRARIVAAEPEDRH